MGRLRGELKSSQDSWWGSHTIINPDTGEPYMTRYWIGKLRLHVFVRGDQDPDCHDHPWDFWTFPLTSYVEEVLHEQRQAYAARGHPPPPKFYRVTHVVKRFRLHKRAAEHCHLVLGSFEGYEKPTFSDDFNHITQEWQKRPLIGNRRIITIVWQAGVRRKWGFWKNREGRWCWEFWKDYILNGGKNAPCGDGPATPPPPKPRR